MERSRRCRCLLMVLAVLLLAIMLAYILHFAWTSTIQQTTSDITGLRAAPSLKFLVIISRHGNRRSIFTFPNDPYPLNDTVHWNYGMGELTTIGRIQLYNLGVKVRSLYNGFLKQHYYNNDLYAGSTSLHRTLLSAQSFLAGLYPPTGFQVWNEKIAWQPIPVYSNSTDKSLLLDECPRYLQARDIWKTNFEEENKASISAVTSYINLHTGSNLTGAKGLFRVWDTLISEDTQGYVLPDWTKKVYPEPMAELVAKLYISYFAATETMTKFVIGKFIEEITGKLEMKVNGTLTPDRQIYYFCGHDVSLVTLQAALGIPKASIIGLVKSGSAIIFELHQDPRTNRFLIQVLYIDGSSANLDPVPLDIPECRQPCDFNQFINITKRFSNFRSFEEECQIAKGLNTIADPSSFF